MGDVHLLHSSTSEYSHYLGSAWDLQKLEAFNTDLSLVMESSCMSMTAPTGYLEDALLVDHYTKRRRRSLLYQNNLCNSGGYRWWVHDNLNCITQTMYSSGSADEEEVKKSKISSMEFQEAAASATTKETSYTAPACSSLTQLQAANNLIPCSASASESSGWSERRKRSNKMIRRGLVYPFEIVKPGGEEGQVSLKDINERMLMPPTRPIRHPVGDYASRPRPYPGLSGNPVLALTTIHTQGRRGTITIITTKS